MPIFRSDRASKVVRGAKPLSNPEGGSERDALPDAGRRGGSKATSLHTPEQRKRVKSKRQELRRKKQELREIRSEALAAKDWAERTEHNKRKKTSLQEIFLLERELRAAEEGRAEGELGTGALPDFVILGTQKGGTSSLYHLLTQHPLVEPAASKELHFFDNNFELGVEWYRRCFPASRSDDDQSILTGEATPYYLFHPFVAERMARVVPDAQLIVLLRNPVDRAYSHHQQEVRKGGEALSFEAAIGAEKARLRSERDKMLEDERYASFEHQRLSYLSRGVYIDQLLRWREFFPEEQILVLKSEDFFAEPRATLRTTIGFLGLPEWEPKPAELDAKRNEGRYEQEMDPSTRRRLKDYFEPHNKRLYELLGTDFGW